MSDDPNDYDDDYDPKEDPDDYFLTWICGMHVDGFCSLAGTEECDWECPRAR